jgi:hypothetical protein
MSAKETKLYPIRGHWLHDTPAVVQVVATKAEAEALIATGAFTDNPNDPERDMDATDLTKPPPAAGPAETEPTEQVGSSDSKPEA